MKHRDKSNKFHEGNQQQQWVFLYFGDCVWDSKSTVKVERLACLRGQG